jgi:hypothetical protein
MSETPTYRTRLAAAAGLLGAAAAVTVVLGVGPAPSVFQLASANGDISGNCDEAEHAADPECAGTPVTGGTVADSSTSTTVDDGSTSTTNGTPSPTASSGAIRSIDAAGAGTVIVAVDGHSLRLVAATPTSGWRVEVEQSAGREIEVDFRNGTKRVQVNVELEDGEVRVRVREDGDDDGDDNVGDNSNSGPGSGDDSGDDDHSGPGHDGDDSHDDGDDHSGSGHGGDDEPGDDHGSGGHSADD